MRRATAEITPLVLVSCYITAAESAGKDTNQAHTTTIFVFLRIAL
jgi:hypothetical protein